MANIDTNNAKGDRKGKPQRKTLRVDFTPMVDMNMLLITFFMFTTTLAIPQIMQVAMPSDADNPLIKAPASKSITVILGEQDKVFYYWGEADYENYTSLKDTDYKGLRDMLVERNAFSLNKISKLRLQQAKDEISEVDFQKQMEEINKSKDGLIVMIKPTPESNYKNVVDALDEMQIAGIGKYMIRGLEESDHFLMENLKTKGSLTAMIDKPKK